jgi:hypothetical protein
MSTTVGPQMVHVQSLTETGSITLQGCNRIQRNQKIGLLTVCIGDEWVTSGVDIFSAKQSDCEHFAGFKGKDCACSSD